MAPRLNKSRRKPTRPPAREESDTSTGHRGTWRPMRIPCVRHRCPAKGTANGAPGGRQPSGDLCVAVRTTGAIAYDLHEVPRRLPPSSRLFDQGRPRCATYAFPRRGIGATASVTTEETFVCLVKGSSE
ncbi:hypothetical protein ISCGN_003977 [Ixodes scapularis]